MFSINTNIASLAAQNYLANSSKLQSATIAQVSSGLRITQSGDDAAGLAIANGYRSDEAVLTQGIRNANDGQGQLQTIDGGLNNISQLLDRARTLATQSASGTFASGDAGRVTLNAEFQSVLQEIDRQAQSIGLNSNGAFAKNLSVFVGGGRAQGTNSQTANGSVAIDLSGSAVDTKSLGLKGVQVAGTGVDLSSGQSTSVQSVINDSANKASESNSGFTTFVISGPGFSDGNKIKLSVNLNGVTDTSTLATAVNTAIQAAGSAGTQYATAFKNANINATITTDSNGAQHLAFNSSSTAFQVEAGDRTSNALLGRTTTPGSTTGIALASTVTGGSATAAASATFGAAGAGSVVFRFQGSGLTAPKDITLTTTSSETVAQAIADLNTQIANDSSLKDAGISLSSSTAGSPLAFTSARGETFSVQTTGDTQNLLGMGSFLASAGASDYTSISAGSAYDNTTARGTANFEFSVNGGASGGAQSISVDLSGGNAVAGSFTGTTIPAIPAAGSGLTAGDKVNVTIDGTVYSNIAVGTLTSEAAVVSAINTVINGSGAGTGTASFVNDKLVITSNSKGVGSTATVTGSNAATNTDLGLSGGTATAGTARTTDNLVAYLNNAISQNATLTAAGISATQSAPGNSGSISFTSNNDSYFRLNTVGNEAIASSTVVGNNFTVGTGVSDQLTLSVDGGPSNTITLSAQSGASAATVAADITAKLAALSTPPNVTVDVAANGSLEFKSSLTGAVSSVTLTTSASHDALAALGLTAGTVTGAGPNTGFGAANGNTFLGNTASVSANSTFDADGANQLSNVSGVAQPLAFGGIAFGSDTQSLTISSIDPSGVAQSINITLGNSSTAGPGGTVLRNARTIDEALATINTQLQQSNNSTLQGIVAVKDDSSGVEKINFLSASTAFKVTAGTTANGTGIGSQGMTASSGTVGGGGTADISNQNSAEAAVTALAAAVTALGDSQAVVGRGENEFGYAANLAQSQLANETAAESQIRDANLAQASATLTKAQILLQAGVAALSQANSAPQALLSLLQGH